MLVLANYNNVDSILVWGGEDNARPEYGKVFIVVKPKNGTLLTTQNLTDIKEIVDTYKPMGIVTSVKSPDYLYLDMKTGTEPSSLTPCEEQVKLGFICATIMDGEVRYIDEHSDYKSI